VPIQGCCSCADSDGLLLELSLLLSFLYIYIRKEFRIPTNLLDCNCALWFVCLRNEVVVALLYMVLVVGLKFERFEMNQMKKEVLKEVLVVVVFVVLLAQHMFLDYMHSATSVVFVRLVEQ
jgi:hypothetical protein